MIFNYIYTGGCKNCNKVDCSFVVIIFNVGIHHNMIKLSDKAAVL